MASPEGNFPIEVDYADTATKRQILLLGVAIETLLDAHDHPERLSMEVLGDVDQHRNFSNGGTLAPEGFVPELTLQRYGDSYNFHSLLVHPARWTASVTGNKVNARYSSVDSMRITEVERLYVPVPDMNGVYDVRKPSHRELTASAAISCVVNATERLSREFSAVRWL